MEPIDPRSFAPWRTEKMGKSTLHQSAAMMVGLNAFEPGQVHAAHAHAGSDKVYAVIEGSGTFSLGERTWVLGPGSVVVAPSGVAHGVAADQGVRLLVLVTMAPPP